MIKSLAAPVSFSHKTVCFFLVTMLVTIACAAQVNYGASLPAELLARAEREETVRVIVELQAETGDVQAAQELALRAVEGTRYRVMRRYQTVPLLALEVSAEALRRLAQSPVVRRIQEDRVVHPQEQSP
jgi:hypothetical protein